MELARGTTPVNASGPVRRSGPTVPLMAVLQEAKGKVRPVLDYREVNEYVNASGAKADVCAEKMREWRRFPENSSTIDIRDAYMQVRVDPECSAYQTVKYNGREYELTRMGFGLNCAPQILKEIASKVLTLSPKIRTATSAYFDDIIVNENEISAQEVAKHLEKYRLPCKPSAKLGEATVLGLRVRHTGKGLMWDRPTPVAASIHKEMTRRQLFLLCCKWVGHFPVVGWLRPAASFVKWLCDGEGGSWEEEIGHTAAVRVEEICRRLEQDDPVKGVWRVKPGDAFVLWCDASSLAMGAALEKDGEIVEDMAWLRKKESAVHINVAELTAVVRGIALALKWKAKDLTIMTDSASAHWWLDSVSGDRRVKMKGDSEMLVRRRLEIIEETLRAYSVSWRVRRVASEENRADTLTRVLRAWLRPPIAGAVVGPLGTPEARAAERAHDLVHRGVKGTLYFAKQLLNSVTEEDARRAVNTCEWCASVSPHPVHVKEGALAVSEVWERLAADITHLREKKFLTIIDCGPSRYAIWKQVEAEDAVSVAKGLEEAFRTFGPPAEVVVDNGLAFRSVLVRQLCDKWRINIHFRCADKPTGNAIIERNHRTVKELAAKREGDVLEAAMLYNITPQGEHWRSPGEVMMNRTWNNPLLQQQLDRPSGQREVRRCGPFEVGDAVWVKPPRARCVDPWREGRVTKINSERNIEVDGMPRHPKDLRRRSAGWHHAVEIQRPVRGQGGGMPEVDPRIQPEGGIRIGDETLNDPEVTFSSSRSDVGVFEETEPQIDGVTFPDEPAVEPEQDVSMDPFDETTDSSENATEVTAEQNEPRRSSRTTRMPERYGDYVTGEEFDLVTNPE